MPCQGTAARSGDPVVDAAKARALGNALVAFLIVPWTFSLIIYSGAPLSIELLATCCIESVLSGLCVKPCACQES